jgi:hypothetical protein
MRVFKNRMLRKISGSKRQGETEGLRKLHNMQLHDLYLSPNTVRVMTTQDRRSVTNVNLLG